MSDTFGPEENRSNKGLRATGIVYDIRRESERHFHGNHPTRHDAIGVAAIIGRITGEEMHVRYHESMWEEREEPLVCDACGFEDWYWPVAGWRFTAGDDGPYCSDECREAAQEMEA